MSNVRISNRRKIIDRAGIAERLHAIAAEGSGVLRQMAVETLREAMASGRAEIARRLEA